MKPDYFRGVEYKGSYVKAEECPSPASIPVVAFTGRSNSGKSSLLSSSCDHQNLARTSKKAVKTVTLNYFLVPPGSSGGPGLYLVDLPGYGYATLSHPERERIRVMVDEYLEATPFRLLVIVLDARRKPAQEEISIRQWCEAHGFRFVFALTKWDKLNNKERSQTLHTWKEFGAPHQPVSNESGYGISEMIKLVRGR